MGEIGTERREVEFEPVPEEPVAEPVRRTEPGEEADPAEPSPAPARR